MHENREISGASRSTQDRDRSAKAQSHNADMHVSEKSDCAILPMNQPNKGESSPAEVGEGRARTKENMVRSNTSPTQRPSVFSKSFRERLAKFGLELHAEKTRLIEFGRFAEQNRKRRGEGKPETFTFLGFTHYCGKRRSDGSFIVWRKTASKRMVTKLRAIKAELIRRKHDPPAQVGEWLRKVVLGYYQYLAVPGNLNQLSAFRHRLCRCGERY